MRLLAKRLRRFTPPCFRRAFLTGMLAYGAASALLTQCTPPRPAVTLIDAPPPVADALVDVPQVRGPRRIPKQPEAWMKRPPCSEEDGEEAINGACYVRLAMKPPCGGKSLEHEGACFRTIKSVPMSIDR